MWLVLVIFLTGSMVYGADPCVQCPVVMALDDVSNGLQSSESPYKITGSPNMRNVFIDNGQIEMIKGFTVVGSTNMLQRGDGIYPFTTEDGQTSFLVTDSSLVLETSNWTSYIFVSSGQTSSVLTRCIQAREKMWCSNGVDPVFTWDRTTKQVLNGENGTPNVPRFKYMAYWQNRIFGLNSLNNASSLDWSDAVSTAGAAIAPDNYLAWPVTNRLFVGRGDGQVGTGLWVKDGRLFVGKERSRYVIFGNNSTSYKDDKIDPQTGLISHDSITVLDGKTYYVGGNGFYEDGLRITDEIADRIETIEKDTSRSVVNEWQSQSDFDDMGKYNGSTSTAGGFVSVNVDTFVVIDNLDGTDAGQSSITFTSAQTSYITTFTVIASSAPDYYKGFVGGGNEIRYSGDSNQRVVAKHIGASPCTQTSARKMTLTNLRTGVSLSRSESDDPSTSFNNFLNFSFSLAQPPVFFDASDINMSSISVKLEFFPPADCTYFVKFPTNSAKLVLTGATTGQYISKVSTITGTITTWGVFDSVRNTNGGSISYYTRTSTSSVNIATQAWVAQAPGTRISAPSINNYIQWASTINSVSTSSLFGSNIDQVSISHLEGGSAVDRPFATEWNNRLWVSVATEPSGKFSVIYVKSEITNENPNAWMPIEGINIRSFGKDASNTFYAGAASTGVFYRLDYGTNFDGAAINPVYETPDIYMNDIYNEKSLHEYLLFADKEPGNTLTLGLSINGGAFTDSFQSLNGSGRAVKLIQNVTGKGHYFRWRFRQTEVDKGMNITNFGVTFKNTGTRKIKE